MLLQPTKDTVTYPDGLTETVNGFDIPVPALDEEFDVALGTARINACGDSRLRGLGSRKPIGFRQWVVHGLFL